MTEIESLTEEEYAYYLAFGNLETLSVQMHQVCYDTIISSYTDG